MSDDVPYAELRLTDHAASEDKPIRIAYSLMFQLMNYTNTGRATLGGPGSGLYPQEINKYMGLQFQEGFAAILKDIIPDGELRVALEGSNTASSIVATDKADHWWVGIKE